MKAWVLGLLGALTLTGCNTVSQSQSSQQQSASLPFYECRPLEKWYANTYPDGYSAPYPRRVETGGEWIYDYSHLYANDPDIYVYSSQYIGSVDWGRVYKGWDRQANNSHFTTLLDESFNCSYHSGRNYKEADLYKKRLSLDAHAIDIFFLVKNVNGVPVVKVGLKPINFKLSDIETRDYLQITSNWSSRDHQYYWSLGVPSVLREPKASEFRVSLENLSEPDKFGISFTDWVFCEECLLNDMKYRNKDISMYARKLEANYGIKAPRFERKSQGGALTLLTGIEKTDIQYMPFFDPKGMMPRQVSFLDYNHNRTPSVTGSEAIVQAGKMGIDYQGATQANALYRAFIYNEYFPLTMKEFLRKNATCDQVDSHSRTHDSPSEIRAVARAWKERAECFLEAANRYDAQAFVDKYDYLKEKEERLGSATIGVDREFIHDLKAQYEYAEYRVDRNMENSDKAYADARSARERDQAYAERERRAKQQWLNTIQTLSNQNSSSNRPARTLRPARVQPMPTAQSSNGANQAAPDGENPVPLTTIEYTAQPIGNDNIETDDFVCLNSLCTHYCKNGECNTGAYEAAERRLKEANDSAVEYFNGEYVAPEGKVPPASVVSE